MRTSTAPPAHRRRRQRPADFRAALFQWYGRHRRDLPWRKTTDPYKIWISEIMLQQTTVAAVLSRYEKWLQVFPDLNSLARAPAGKVLKAWQGLGYYQRARNLHRAARILVKRRGGVFPPAYEDLIKLPGFGPYTASAVASLAFGKPFPVLEANVRRILMRLAGLDNERRSIPDRVLLQCLHRYFSPERPAEFNQAMMELGALVCRSRNPDCLHCPVRNFCRAYENGKQEIIPRRRQDAAQKVEAVVAVIRRNGRVLIQKRPPTGLLAGLWEFPGGKRRPRESLETALRREIREELGADIEVIEHLLTVKHSYTKFRVTLHAYACRLIGHPRLLAGERRWVSLNSLDKYPFPSGSARIIRFLQERHGGFPEALST